MKSFPSNTLVVLLVRIFLGGLFVAASLEKIADPDAFTASILNYKIIGPTLSTAFATILPPLELLCGLCLILGLYTRTSALLITLMLVVFTVLIQSALLRGLDISCGCFTQDPGAAKIGYQKIAENIGMILLGVYLLFARNYGISFTQVFRQKQSK
jgi:putative oxidoreductase